MSSGDVKQLPRLHIGKIEKEPEVKEEKIVIYSEQDFFDRVKKALKSQEVYANFLRCNFLSNLRPILLLVTITTKFRKQSKQTSVIYCIKFL